MPPRTKAAEPSGEETKAEEPDGEAKSGLSEQDRGWIREEIRGALDELLAPGPEEAGIPEDKLEKPEAPRTQSQIEDMAEKVVKKAMEVLSPPKEEKEEKPEPERPPKVSNPIRKFLWGEE
jgi:hypothetical protein